MVYFLRNILENTQVKYERHFEVMRDLRKGGLNPTMYQEFLDTVNQLPDIHLRKISDYNIFSKFNLSNLTEADVLVINNEFQRRAKNISKTCWHPLASSSTCKVDRSGKIIVTEAHSIQNNGILSKIAENGHVIGYSLDAKTFEAKQIGKNIASTFLGFCNEHDAIFYPIETSPYVGTEQQHFLFAYRAFVVSFHKKKEVSYFLNFGEQAENDIEQNKTIFDAAIISGDYSVIKTDVFELSAYYPIAVSSAINLEVDFEGNPILHSENRMENAYITLFPKDNKTIFLISYFEQDKSIYEILGAQIRERNNIKLDISILIALSENIFFNPTYYNTFIEQSKEKRELIAKQGAFDDVDWDENNQIIRQSFITSDFLNNPLGVNFFGY